MASKTPGCCIVERRDSKGTGCETFVVERAVCVYVKIIRREETKLSRNIETVRAVLADASFFERGNLVKGQTSGRQGGERETGGDERGGEERGKIKILSAWRKFKAGIAEGMLRGFHTVLEWLRE